MKLRVLWKTFNMKGTIVSSLYASNLGTFQEVELDNGEIKFIHISELEIIQETN